jgi:hypothetical protein
VCLWLGTSGGLLLNAVINLRVLCRAGNTHSSLKWQPQCLPKRWTSSNIRHGLTPKAEVIHRGLSLTPRHNCVACKRSPFSCLVTDIGIILICTHNLYTVYNIRSLCTYMYTLVMFVTLMNNSLEQSSSVQSNSRSANEEIPRLVLNRKLHYHIQKAQYKIMS